MAFTSSSKNLYPDANDSTQVYVKHIVTTWYLTEGYTGGEFDTWVLIQNPGEEEAQVTLEFRLPQGSSANPYSFKLPAGTRKSINLTDIPGLSDTDVSTKVTSDKPVVAEWAMYFDYNGKRGGHD